MCRKHGYYPRDQPFLGTIFQVLCATRAPFVTLNVLYNSSSNSTHNYPVVTDIGQLLNHCSSMAWDQREATDIGEKIDGCNWIQYWLAIKKLIELHIEPNRRLSHWAGGQGCSLHSNVNFSSFPKRIGMNLCSNVWMNLCSNVFQKQCPLSDLHSTTICAGVSVTTISWPLLALLVPPH